MGKPADLVQGTLDLLILKTVALQPMHGWGSHNASSRFQKKCCKSIRARCIRLTRDGAKYLRQQRAQWSWLSLAIDLVLNTT